jgi:hypothetical protein
VVRRRFVCTPWHIGRVDGAVRGAGACPAARADAGLGVQQVRPILRRESQQAHIESEAPIRNAAPLPAVISPEGRARTVMHVPQKDLRVRRGARRFPDASVRVGHRERSALLKQENSSGRTSQQREGLARSTSARDQVRTLRTRGEPLGALHAPRACSQQSLLLGLSAARRRRSARALTYFVCSYE